MDPNMFRDMFKGLAVVGVILGIAIAGIAYTLGRAHG